MEFQSSGRGRIRAALLGAALGLLVFLPAIVLAFLSSGGGHGDYVAARILFPYSMLLTLIEGAIGPVALLIGIIQFPLYGGTIALPGSSKPSRAVLTLGTFHLAAVVACFSEILPSYS